jgi:hypothetical protein
MKAIKYILPIILIAFFSCEMPVQEITQQDSNQMDSSDFDKPKDASWYRARGYQVFSSRNLAVKAPVRLENMASQTRERHDFNFGGVENSRSESRIAFYQIIINNLPRTYQNLSDSEKIAFEEKMIRESFPRDAKQIEFKGLKAFILSYSHDGYMAKSLMFIKDGRTYGFNLITNNNLEAKFEEYINNIQFIDYQ